MQNDHKVEAIVNAAKGHKVAIIRGRGEAGARQDEVLKAALDKAGIESEIVDPPSFKLPTTGDVRILVDDSQQSIQHWIDNSALKATELPFDAQVREVIGWPVLAVPTRRSARLQKKCPRDTEVRTMHMSCRLHKRLFAAAELAAEAANAKRAAWRARYKVPTRRKHGR